MPVEAHPQATPHLPFFVTAPGETDVLLVMAAAMLVLSVLAVGILFFRLHALPERIAHRTHKTQFEIVAVLGLISLFTHQHAFWIAGLLLAFIEFPDFLTPVRRIVRALEKIARISHEPEEAPRAKAHGHGPSHGRPHPKSKEKLHA